MVTVRVATKMGLLHNFIATQRTDGFFLGRASGKR